MTIALKGKIVLITCASRGIGLGIAKRFANAGAALHILADEDAIHARAKELGATGLQADITDPKAVDRALVGLGHIDVLINNAGLELLTPIAEEGSDIEDKFRRIIEINVIGTAIVTRRALPRLKEGGSIINTASVWGRKAEPLFGAYVASKHAVIGLTKTWARELGARGIRVNAVCPGWVRTEASLRSLKHMAERRRMSEDDLLAEIIASQALPGLMEPADVAETYLFLASDLSRDITGQSLGIDRGRVPVVKQLEGKRALVTGAASGIGRATAQALKAEGAEVIGLDLAAGEQPVPILACDLVREKAIIAAVGEAKRRLGGFDIIVNNAGIMREAAIGDITADDIDQHFAINVRGAILVTREALPALSDGARVVNIASELAYLGRANGSVYCATKAAILGLTRSWARELAPRILVNAIAPGPIDTPLLGFERLSESQRASEIAHPLGRIGKPEEIAAAVVFLVGPGATFFTGQCLGANGGAAMY